MKKYLLLACVLFFPTISWAGNYPVGTDWIKLTMEGKKMYLEGINDGAVVAQTFLVEELKYPLSEVMIKKYSNLQPTPADITAKVLPIVFNNNYEVLVPLVDEFFKDPQHKDMTVITALKEIKKGEKITIDIPKK